MFLDTLDLGDIFADLHVYICFRLVLPSDLCDVHLLFVVRMCCRLDFAHDDA
jgi:hypothetical protein